MIKKIISLLMGAFVLATNLGIAFAENSISEAVISSDDVFAIKKNVVFDASQSFLPETNTKYSYEWDFGDGNRNEGVEVLHSYKNTGWYTVKLKITGKNLETETEKNIFVCKKLILFLTDENGNKNFIETVKTYAEQEGIFIKTIDSYGSASEFISEEILSKKLSESVDYMQKASQLVVWTKENAGLNALSRLKQEKGNSEIDFTQKTIVTVTSDPSSYSNRIKMQFQAIKPKEMVLIKEAGVYPLIDNFTSKEFTDNLKAKGYEYKVITESSYSLRPWNFMSYFLSILVNKGIPDNTIALLLLLPVIATVIAFMKQVVGLTTMGIYTPIIITLSFLIIGLYFGLTTLVIVLIVGGIARHLLRNANLLFMPKMAIVLTLVAITLFLILIMSSYLNFVDAKFFSLAIFPMVILSTLVEKFVSIKTEKGLTSAILLMAETIVVSIIAYFIAGGEINIGFTILKFEGVRNLILNYPEFTLVLIVINVLLGKWSGLRLLEFVRFREVLRHIEEEE